MTTPVPKQFQSAERCKATTKTDKPCKSPAMTNGFCRMHGGRNVGGQAGNQNGFKHGRYSKKHLAEKRKEAKELKMINMRAKIFGLQDKSVLKDFLKKKPK